MKVSFLLCILSLVLAQVKSQTTIHGWVRDHKMRPLVGANITVKNGYDGAITDSSGNYTFVTADLGRDTIIFSIAGYGAVEKIIELIFNLNKEAGTTLILVTPRF